MNRILVFGRYPEPGNVKTRLIPLLGPAGAADLHRRLTEKTLATAVRVPGALVVLHYTGATPRQVKRWLCPDPVAAIPQSNGDIGRRMATAFERAFKSGAKRVVLVGTDIPGMTSRHLHRAIKALEDHEVVLGPSTDGGYWLVGLKRPADIFSGIRWSTPTVLAQTLSRINAGGLRVKLVDRLSDIDTPDDLAAHFPGGEVPNPYLSVVVPTLNEASHIRRTLRRAADPSAEIIVVDGGSSDNTAAVASYAGARVVVGEKGRAAQQNQGASIARGAVLLFLHADTLLPKNYVQHVFEILMDRKTALGAFSFKTDSSHPGMRIIEWAVRIRSRVFKLPYGDQALFMRKSAFIAGGGFPLVPIAEDLYYTRTAAKTGRIVISAAPAVTSSRRWTATGILRTTVVNYIIAAGCLIGVAPEKLAPIYRINRKQ